MSDSNLKPLLEFILEMIKEAESVVERHSGTYNALNDFEGKNAILLNLIQIGEKLNKIDNHEIKAQLPVEEAYSVRNRITHDYGGIDLEIVEYIVDKELPELQSKIQEIFKTI